MSEIARTTVLTANDVANQIQSKGLDALGLTVPTLGTIWSDAAPGALDDATLRLSLSSVRAPFTGTFRYEPSPSPFSAVDGTPLAGPVGVLTLHPEAVHRLETLVRTRLGALQRPLPVAMVVHGLTIPNPVPAMGWFRGGEDLGLGTGAAVSFHDRRGLVIDPVAVASLFADLLNFRPGLAGSGSTATATSAGGVATIAALTGPAVRVHVISPHGAAYRSRRDVGVLEVITAIGALARVVPASGMVDLAGGEQLGRATMHSADDDAAQHPLLWGLAPGGTLDTVPLSSPALPAGPSLPRQFLRVVAVDLGWHLLGNRGYAPGDPGIPSDDDRPVNAPLPTVRRTVPGVDFLIDGNDVLGAMGAVAAGLPASADQRALLCSPLIEPALGLPPSPGPGGHWPAFPPGPVPGAGDGAAVRRYDATGTGAPTAAWRAASPGPLRDVVVTFPATSLPAGTHVRVYPRTFRLITGIGADPSFVRGDGGSVIVPATGTFAVLLANPFGLDATEPVPDPAVASVDVVAVARDGTRRMLSSIDLPVGTPVTFTDDPTVFGGNVAPTVAALLAVPGATSIAPTTTFGIPQVPTPAPLPAPGATPAADDLIGWLRTLANEGTSPRIGPHLPTQGRLDTVLAVGAVPGGGSIYAWEAVLSGARWGAESRSAQPDQGDPGNPAGPDAHVTGMRVSGQLGYDLALHAIKRSQPVIPFSGLLGWLVQTAGDNWDEPPADAAPPAGQPHLAGAMLETIAAYVDSPELSLVPMPGDTDSVQTLVGAIATAMGLPPPTITVGNEDRLRRQLQREIATAAKGQRDAMWSLARAIAEAQEYVLVESPTFAQTARPDGTHPEDGLVDLVTMLADRLTANPRLKVMVCVPRLPDFPESSASWFRSALAQRTAALELLVAAAPDRVAAFHPIGFPGRSTVGRSSVVLVDDMYAFVGTSHWRRRGMTFDGGCDVVSLDRRLDDRGVSAAIARFRQELLATRLGVPIPAGVAGTSALWTRLAEPESAFDVARDLLTAGGLGRCAPVWAGPTDTTVIPEDTDKTDPNGLLGVGLMTMLTGLLP